LLREGWLNLGLLRFSKFSLFAKFHTRTEQESSGRKRTDYFRNKLALNSNINVGL